MARDQSQYTVQINADASRAKKEINDLLPSYTKRKYGMEHKI